MKTKLIMTLTAIFLFVIAIVLSFAPDHVMAVLGISNSVIIRLVLQLLGAAYYGFAILNWMAKGALIGGIYNRPIAIGNLAHFILGGAALIKVVLSNHQLPMILSIIAGCFLLMACVFGVIISRHPGKTAV